MYPPAFRRTVSSPCSVSKWPPACHLILAGFLFGLPFDIEAGGSLLTANRLWTSTRLHGVKSQAMVLVMTTAVITSNPTKKIDLTKQN
jgi:hypothetical protein